MTTARSDLPPIVEPFRDDSGRQYASFDSHPLHLANAASPTPSPSTPRRTPSSPHTRIPPSIPEHHEPQPQPGGFSSKAAYIAALDAESASATNSNSAAGSATSHGRPEVRTQFSSTSQLPLLASTPASPSVQGGAFFSGASETGTRGTYLGQGDAPPVYSPNV